VKTQKPSPVSTLMPKRTEPACRSAVAQRFQLLYRSAGPAPHTEPIAGSPLKRERKQGIRLDDDSVVAFPRMPRVADLPKDWRHWSPARKIEHLLGMSLAFAAERALQLFGEARPVAFAVGRAIATSSRPKITNTNVTIEKLRTSCRLPPTARRIRTSHSPS
jgi:hypothetical protein